MGQDGMNEMTQVVSLSTARRNSQQLPHWNAIDRQKRIVSSRDVLLGVSAVLEHFIARSDGEVSDGLRSETRKDFDGPVVDADSTVHGFLEHILRSGLCSKECFIMSLVYAERILQRHPDFVISRRNVHRFVLISVLVGSKIIDDFYCRNVYYAMAGGLSKAELNELELRLCFLLDFDLNVDAEVFAQYRDALIRSPTTYGKTTTTSNEISNLCTPIIIPEKQMSQPSKQLPQPIQPQPEQLMQAPANPQQTHPYMISYPVQALYTSQQHISTISMPMPIVIPSSALTNWPNQQVLEHQQNHWNGSNDSVYRELQPHQNAVYQQEQQQQQQQAQVPTQSHSDRNVIHYGVAPDPLGAACAWFSVPSRTPALHGYNNAYVAYTHHDMLSYERQGPWLAPQVM